MARPAGPMRRVSIINHGCPTPDAVALVFDELEAMQAEELCGMVVMFGNSLRPGAERNALRRAVKRTFAGEARIRSHEEENVAPE